MEMGTKVSQPNMKKLVFILFLGILNGLFAQKDSALISRNRPGLLWYFTGLRPAKTDNHKYDRFVIDLTYNDWVGALKPFNNRWNSIGINMNLMKDIRFKKTSIFSIGAGFGYGFSKISSHQQFIVSEDGILTNNIKNTGIYDHARLNTQRFYIPLELRFSSKKWSHAKLAIGGTFGLNAAMKQTLFGRDGAKKLQTDLQNEAPVFNYGLHVRFGIRNVALFGSYQISNVFKNPKEANLNVIQFGLSFSLF
jgi:hypothetical protein